MFNNTSSIKIDDNIKTDLILKEGVDIIPKQVIPSIQPVYEVNRRINNVLRVLSWTATGGGTTVYATPADRDFYLTGVYYSAIKDVACDQASSAFLLNVVVTGATIGIPLFETLTLTAQEARGSHIFTMPIKVDRGSSITTSARAFTAGVFRGRVIISGYTNTTAQPELPISSA